MAELWIEVENLVPDNIIKTSGQTNTISRRFYNTIHKKGVM